MKILGAGAELFPNIHMLLLWGPDDSLFRPPPARVNHAA